MARTAEQRAADEALHEAIERAVRAYEAGRGLIQEWVVVVAEITPAESPEDDEETYSIMMKDGGLPWHRAVGLLYAGIRQFHLEPDDD